jgi:hypothetical protein
MLVRLKPRESFNAGPPVDPAEVAKYLPPVDSPTAPMTQSLPEEFSLAKWYASFAFA